MLFKCELIDGHVVRERFYRAGETAEAVLDGLDLFEWPRGEWRIEPAEYEEAYHGQ